MPPTKEWSVLSVTYPRPLGGKLHTLETPSKQTFQRRFSIIDPFQKPYLAGHIVLRLGDVWDTLRACEVD